MCICSKLMPKMRCFRIFPSLVGRRARRNAFPRSLRFGSTPYAGAPRNCATRNTSAIATASVADSDLKPEKSSSTTSR